MLQVHNAPVIPLWRERKDPRSRSTVHNPKRAIAVRLCYDSLVPQIIAQRHRAVTHYVVSLLTVWFQHCEPFRPILYWCPLGLMVHSIGHRINRFVNSCFAGGAGDVGNAKNDGFVTPGLLESQVPQLVCSGICAQG
jgi:hypothetical protein